MACEPKVSFLIVGVQKGGTTALFDHLGDYADIALSTEKELHFFDDDALDWAHADYAPYEARFPRAAGRPCGEATPIYIYWPDALARIAAYNSAMRFVLVLRDPVERAWSHWRMETARGVETRPFSWCIREGRARLFDAEPWGFHREFSYVERGYYGEQVSALLTRFPAEQLLVMTSDQLRANPLETINSVRAFLDLAPAAEAPAREVHVGAGPDGRPDASDILFLREIYRRDAERLADLTGVRFDAKG